MNRTLRYLRKHIPAVTLIKGKAIVTEIRPPGHRNTWVSRKKAPSRPYLKIIVSRTDKS
jgi:hypothetical protein